MQMSRLTTLSALMLGVALIATPVLAAGSTAGSKGSGEAMTTRDAPLTPPAGLAPKPVPQVDTSSLSRGPIGMDAAAAAESMGTVTLSRDGTVGETPASEGMRAILAEEMKGSNPTMTTDRVVDATDDRVQITDSNNYPDAVVGWLWMQDQKGEWSTCTGTLIGPKTVITAAHCVYDHDTGGWVQSLTFLPGHGRCRERALRPVRLGQHQHPQGLHRQL